MATPLPHKYWDHAAGLNLDLQNAVVTGAAGATTEVVATPGAGFAIWVYGYSLSADINGSWLWESAANDIYTAKPISALGGETRDAHHPCIPCFKCVENEALNITTVASAVTGGVSYAIIRTS